jgi:hypothetical protein
MAKKTLYKKKSKNAKIAAQPKLFPDKDEAYTIGWLQERLEEMNSMRPDEDWELRYDQDRASVTWNEDGTANVNVPIERSTRRLKKADEEAGRPQVKFVPVESDDVKKIEVINPVWDFVWNEANTDEELSRARDMKHIFGTVWWKEYVKEDIRTSYEFVDVNDDGKLKATAKESKVSWIEGKPIDIRDIWVDPVRRFDDAVDIFERERDVGRDVLENLKNDPNYKNIEEALKVSSAEQQETFRTPEEKGVSQRSVGGESDKFDLYHYVNQRKGIYIVSVNMEVIIREGVNPCPSGDLGYVPWVDEANYESIYGLGIPEQLETFKYEINYTSNQLMDVIRQTSSNYIALFNEASIDSSELVSGVGTILNIDADPGNFQWQSPPPTDKGLGNVISFLENQVVQATGIDPKATVGQTADTLGQEEIKEINRLKSISNSIKQFNYFMVRMARLRLAYIQTYLPFTTGRKIVGEQTFRKIVLKDKEISPRKVSDGEGGLKEEGIKVEDRKGQFAVLELEPDTLKGNLDVLVETPSTSMIMKQIEKLQLDELTKLVIETASVNPEILQKIKLDDILKEKMSKINLDPDNFFDTSSDELKESQDVRQSVLEDLPLPFKPDTQPVETVNPNLKQNVQQAIRQVPRQNAV